MHSLFLWIADEATFYDVENVIASIVCLHKVFKLQLHAFYIRNHFISNIVLDSLKFKKLLGQHRKSQEAFEK